MSRSAGNRLVRLGDVAATLLFVAQFAHPPCSRELHHRVSYRVSATDYSPPITPGAALRRLAVMQEWFYLVHGHYAQRASDLTDPALPPRWRAVVVAASAGRYRMRLDAPGEGGSGFVCHLWDGACARKRSNPSRSTAGQCTRAQPSQLSWLPRDRTGRRFR